MTSSNSAVSRIAIVGTGVIAPVYAATLAELGSVELAAVVDGIPERADEFATMHNTTARSFDEVLADPAIDAIVNLTPPLAHANVTAAALRAGKATFSEKPLGVDFDEARELVALAQQHGVRLGCAPDTFLGAGLQTCRAAIDRGDIGTPIGANAFMLGFGPEWWHPNPDLFYRRGAGPLLDMGPYYLTALIQMLGPASAINASAQTPRSQRPIWSKPRRGEMLDVEVPTHVTSLIDFECGATATLVTSFDVAASRYRNIEIYGTEATLSLPDPNTFGGPVQIRGIRDKEWREVALAPTHIPQQRGIGLADMMSAQRNQRPHRANADLALHVVEIMTNAMVASDTGTRVSLTTTCERSQPLDTAAQTNPFE